MKGTKGLFRLGAIASSMVLMIALSLMVLAGCPTEDDDPSGSGKSLAISSNAAAKTLTLTLTGGTWKDTAAEANYVFQVVGKVFEVTGGAASDIAWTGAISNGGKTLTCTGSADGYHTGTFTFTPERSFLVGTGGIWESFTSFVDGDRVYITGSAVTFTIPSGSDSSGYSLAVSGNATAKTLTLTLTGATWAEEDVVWNSAIPAYVYEVSGTGDIENGGSVSYAGAVSNGSKTLTLTVSKRNSNTGTITFTPKASVETSYLEGYTNIRDDGTEVPITGSAITFTIN